MSQNDLRTRLLESRAALLDGVGNASHEAFIRRPPPSGREDDDRWAVRDVLWHVGNRDQRWRAWMEAELAGTPQQRATPRQPRPAAMNTLPLLLGRLEETRAATLALLDTLDAQALERRGARPGGDGELSFAEVFGLLIEHDREHAAHIGRLLDPMSEEA